MKHILTLTDFSKIAEEAVTSAFEFAKRNNADLTIYHQLEKNEFVDFQDSDVSFFMMNENSFESYNPIIAKWKQMKEDYGVKLNIIIGHSNFIKTIQNIVDFYTVDMLIIGSTGASGKKEVFRGSNAQNVILKVDCPVLTLKKPLNSFDLGNFVYASSFDAKEKASFRYFLDFIKPSKGSIIHLLAVNTMSYFSQPTLLMKEAMADFEKIAEGYQVQSHFYPDYSVDAGIRHFLNEFKPDILVMSNKLEKPFKHAIQGSNALRAVNHADFPVLTIDYSV